MTKRIGSSCLSQLEHTLVSIISLSGNQMCDFVDYSGNINGIFNCHLSHDHHDRGLFLNYDHGHTLDDKIEQSSHWK